MIDLKEAVSKTDQCLKRLMEAVHEGFVTAEEATEALVSFSQKVNMIVESGRAMRKGDQG